VELEELAVNLCGEEYEPVRRKAALHNKQTAHEFKYLRKLSSPDVARRMTNKRQTYADEVELSVSLIKWYKEVHTRVYPKVSGLSRDEIYASNNKHWLRSNIKGYGGKTH
jgi:hypothetical protein